MRSDVDVCVHAYISSLHCDSSNNDMHIHVYTRNYSTSSDPLSSLRIGGGNRGAPGARAPLPEPYQCL